MYYSVPVPPFMTPITIACGIRRRYPRPSCGKMEVLHDTEEFIISCAMSWFTTVLLCVGFDVVDDWDESLAWKSFPAGDDSLVTGLGEVKDLLSKIFFAVNCLLWRGDRSNGWLRWGGIWSSRERDLDSGYEKSVEWDLTGDDVIVSGPEVIIET